MKKLRIISLLSLILIWTTNVKAQSFEGKIEFSVEYTEVPARLEGHEYMLPSETFYYVKGNMLRTEVPMPMGGDQVIIFDNEKNEGVMLVNILGTKKAITMSSEYLKAEEEKLEQNGPSIIYLDEYKTIAGYKCQKAEITQGEQSTVVYFTDKIPLVGQNFKGLKGIPLQSTIDQDGVKSTLMAISISNQNVPAALFEIPDDYEKTSIEEFIEEAGNE